MRMRRRVFIPRPTGAPLDGGRAPVRVLACVCHGSCYILRSRGLPAATSAWRVFSLSPSLPLAAHTLQGREVSGLLAAVDTHARRVPRTPTGSVAPRGSLCAVLDRERRQLGAGSREAHKSQPAKRSRVRDGYRINMCVTGFARTQQQRYLQQVNCTESEWRYIAVC